MGRRLGALRDVLTTFELLDIADAAHRRVLMRLRNRMDLRMRFCVGISVWRIENVLEILALRLLHYRLNVRRLRTILSYWEDF